MHHHTQHGRRAGEMAACLPSQPPRLAAVVIYPCSSLTCSPFRVVTSLSPITVSHYKCHAYVHSTKGRSHVSALAMPECPNAQAVGLAITYYTLYYGTSPTHPSPPTSITNTSPATTSLISCKNLNRHMVALTNAAYLPFTLTWLVSQRSHAK